MIVGALWAVANAIDLLTVRETSHWPVAPGSVIASAITADTVGHAYYGRGGARYAVVERRLHVTYTYVVDGYRFPGTRYSILLPSKREATARVLSQYPAGAAVMVHYDPADRATAVLDTSIPARSITQIILGLVVALGTWAATRPHDRDP